MDRLLIIASTKDNGMVEATELGLNSNQYFIVTSISEFKELDVDEGLYCFTDNAPLDGLEIKFELEKLKFIQLPAIESALRSYIRSLIDEINSILSRFEYSHWDNTTKNNLVNQIKKMFDSCRITEDNGFYYEIQFSNDMKHAMRLDPKSDKMGVLKDLINAVSITRF